MTISANNLVDTTGIQIKDAFVVIIKTAWNETIVNALEAGCIEVLKQNSITYKTITVPGAFEIPFIIHKYWQHIEVEAENDLLDEEFLFEIEEGEKFKPKKIIFPDAFIALGCIIKGDTAHFDYVCSGVTQGLMQLNTSLPVPSINGVLTVNSNTQAEERIGGVHGHKGKEAAAAAIKMIALVKGL